MKNNKLKDNIIISYQINTQKIKNLIHLNDLKKLKKFSQNKLTNYDSYITFQSNYIFKKLARKYHRGAEYYRKKVISDIIDNEATHLVATFKDFLIFGDYSEFLQGYFHKNEIQRFLPLIFDYYHTSTVIFPNYVVLDEKKYIYKNIQKKQQIINIQQDQEEKEQKKKNKQKQKEKNDDNDNINFDSDLTSKSDILTSHALNSILNQTNTSNNRKLFGLNRNRNNSASEEINDFIEKLKNEEKKINIKNKSIKNKTNHIISIYKGNNNKKDNNKSNTNTYNTISTKNNTKVKEKEKSNLETKSFSDKNIKKNYNLSSLSLNNLKNMNKNFLLKLDIIKRKNEARNSKNAVIEISSLNTSRKYKKINYYYKRSKKSQNLQDFNKSKLLKINEKKIYGKETLRNNNYNHLKRIKSCYGMDDNFSRNKKIFNENTIYNINSNSSNKNYNINGLTNFKVCSTLNNINNNENNLLSIETDKKHKKPTSKKNKHVIDYKIINMIYSKRLPINSSNKNFLVTTKSKTSRNKNSNIINHQISIPLENKKIFLRNNKNLKYNLSQNNSKLINPFESRVSPLNTYRSKNRRNVKYNTLFSPIITSKYSTSKLKHKNQLNKSIHTYNKKKKIRRVIKETISYNKNISGTLNANNNFLTINIDKNHSKNHRIPNPIDMKKNFDNKNFINTAKTSHHKTKKLCNQISNNYVKDKK